MYGDVFNQADRQLTWLAFSEINRLIQSQGARNTKHNILDTTHNKAEERTARDSETRLEVCGNFHSKPAYARVNITIYTWLLVMWC